MIYTITANPAVDLVIQVDDVQLGELNRSMDESYVAGGKGINVSVLLERLGHKSIATGFIGGFTGKFILDQLEKEGVKTQFIPVNGITRINVKLKSQKETEINAAGPHILDENMQSLLAYLDESVKVDDVVFLSGNTAPGMDEKDYQAISKLTKEKGAMLVLDSNRQLLTACLGEEPFLIKPNQEELEEIFETKISTEEDIVKYAQQLQAKGARNVIVSRGGKGALLITEEGQVYKSGVPNGRVINSVGAGDSMLAGFMASYIDNNDYSKALLQGAAAGSATAYSVGIGEYDLIEKLKDEIDVEKIN